MDHQRPDNNKPNSLLAGAAKTDITPAHGTFINGDFVTHYVRYVHDPLFAKALLLRNDQTTIALIVVDICVMPQNFVEKVKSEISNQTGIPFQNILISSTHTHAAGSIESVYLAPADISYANKLHDLIVKTVYDALQTLRPAKTAFGSVDVPEHVRCRRYFMQKEFKSANPVTGGIDQVKTNPFGNGQYIERPAAQTDPQVSFLAVQGIDGRWISILGNYSLHYVGDWENGTISADYFGIFSGMIQEKLKAGDDFVGMMSNGTSGDINIWQFEDTSIYPSEHFKKSELIGNDIAQKVSESLHQIKWDDNPELKVQYDELFINLRKPSVEDLEKAIKIVTETSYEDIEVNDDTIKNIYAREQVLLNELPDQLLIPVQAFKIGSGIIGGLAGEIFAETGLWLKENSPVKKYFTIGLSNGYCGYVPPASELERGGYETWKSRTSKLEQDAEEKLRTKQLELINKLWL